MQVILLIDYLTKFHKNVHVHVFFHSGLLFR